MMGIITAAGRQDPSAPADFERLFKSMVAYSGPLAIDEKARSFVNRVDTAWQLGWVGTEQLRCFAVEGDTLRIRSAEQALPQFGDRRRTNIVTFRRA